MRRRAAPKRKIIPDSKYESEIIAKFMNQLMVDGKKSIAESIVYGAFEQLEKDSKGEDPVEVFKKIFSTFSFITVLIQSSKIVWFLIWSNGLGFSSVKGFSLLPNPAQRIKALLIFINFF